MLLNGSGSERRAFQPWEDVCSETDKRDAAEVRFACRLAVGTTRWFCIRFHSSGLSGARTAPQIMSVAAAEAAKVIKQALPSDPSPKRVFRSRRNRASSSPVLSLAMDLVLPSRSSLRARPLGKRQDG